VTRRINAVAARYHARSQVYGNVQTVRVDLHLTVEVNPGEPPLKVQSNKWIAVALAAILVAGIGTVTSLVAIRPAAATTQFATQTGKSCGDCHTNAKGGGALTPLGEKFKANGNKMPN
jgi:mono/diheme cytochrome c family protein